MKGGGFTMMTVLNN